MQKQVKRLIAALLQIGVPSKLAAGNRELRHGLAVLDSALADRIRLAHPPTVGPFINADAEIITAFNLMDAATANLNREDPRLHLKPI